MTPHIGSVTPGVAAEHPAIGRTRLTGIRKLVLTGIPYIITYRVTLDDIEILTVMHAAQRWPEEL